MSIQLQHSGILLLFYSLLFWINVCMLLGFGKGLSMRYPQYTRQEQTNQSTRLTILGCDKMTV